MRTSETVGKIGAALSKAQGQIKGAIADSKNPHFGSDYADLMSCWDACREPLATNEIAVVQSPRTDANLASMITLLIHSSGEWIELDPLTVQGRDAAPQAIGSCLTYLRRYQLCGAVGIAPKDDDAEKGEGRGQKQAEPKSQDAAVEKRTQEIERAKAETASKRAKPITASDIAF